MTKKELERKIKDLTEKVDELTKDRDDLYVDKIKLIGENKSLDKLIDNAEQQIKKLNLTIEKEENYRQGLEDGFVASLRIITQEMRDK